jgi:hypothetical protein
MTATTPIEELEVALRGELNARAVGLRAGRPPVTRIVAAARRDRTRRRSFAGTGFVLVAALIAATAPAVLGAAHGPGAASAAAGGGGPSPLLTMAPRGDLVRNAAFMQAVEERLPGERVLYANDDGVHTIVIGADAPTRPSTLLRTLVGNHDASASQLEAAAGDVGIDVGAKTYTFVGEFTSTSNKVPLVVLGPMDLAGIEYATGIKLTEQYGKLVPVRTGVKQVAAVDGVAETELADTSALSASGKSSLYFAVRAKLGREYVSTTPAIRILAATTAGNIEDADYDPIRAAVVAESKAAGIPLALKGPEGDALADNVALVLSDVANLAGIAPTHVTAHVAWVGRETPERDSAFVEFSASGLPTFQAFIRGLAPGVPANDSPSLSQSFVRPARPLTQGRFPTTAAAFGGTPEFTTIGGGLFDRW